MKRKSVNNSEPTSKIFNYSGICKKLNEHAEVIIHAIGTYQAKTDLNKTYRKTGASCSLLSDGICCDDCPLITDKEFK